MHTVEVPYASPKRVNSTIFVTHSLATRLHNHSSALISDECVCLLPAGGHRDFQEPNIQARNSTASQSTGDNGEPQKLSPGVFVPIHKPAPHTDQHPLGLCLHCVLLPLTPDQLAPVYMHCSYAAWPWGIGLAEAAYHGLADVGPCQVETGHQGL